MGIHRCPLSQVSKEVTEMFRPLPHAMRKPHALRCNIFLQNSRLSSLVHASLALSHCAISESLASMQRVRIDVLNRGIIYFMVSSYRFNFYFICIYRLELHKTQP
jgi:hypothetical protein